MNQKLIKIPFNKPSLVGNELAYIRKAHKLRQLAGDGEFTKIVHKHLEERLQAKCALLTHSATAALEMMAILVDIKPGDEVIMPSYTFVSTANAFVLRGGVPVFVDIRLDTLNLDEKRIEKSLTKRTKAIVPVHYAGVSCEMDSILKIANANKLFVLEDAAQGFMSQYKHKQVGTIGHMSAFSFHETKNVISGEGGALVINDDRFIERAKIIREKGTNRTKFFNGKVDKYTWVDIGSSYLPGELVASFLLAQLEKADKITKKRLRLWKRYHQQLHSLHKKEKITIPFVPETVTHNAHIFYILARDKQERTRLAEFLLSKDILAVSHYVPLHSSDAGKKYGLFREKLSVTEQVSDRLLRLPLYYSMKNIDQDKVIMAIHDFYSHA